MARHHMTQNGPVPFTAEEEAARDAEEAQWVAQQSQPATTPTKEELFAQLQELQAKIQSLT